MSYSSKTPLPSPPTDLRAVYSGGILKVSWKASVSATKLVLYRVLYRRTGTLNWALGPLTQSLTASISHLVPGVYYSLIVQASNQMGTSTSAILQVTTLPDGVPPSQAQNLTISSITSTSLVVSWTPPATGDLPFSYQLQMQTAGVGSYVNIGLQTTQTSESVTGLVPVTAYSFQIVTSNSTGNSTSSSVGASTIALIPGAPTGLALNGAVSQTTIPLTWNTPATGTLPLTFQVFSRTPSGAGSFAAGQTTSSTSIVVIGLQAGTSYDFEVVASNSAGAGPASNILTNITTTGIAVAPSTPTNLAAGTITSSSIQMSWSPSATGTQPISYVLQYRQTPATTFVPNAPTGLTAGTTTSSSVPLSWTAPTIGTLPFTYNITSSPSGANTWTQAGTSSVASFTVTGLSASTAYDFEVTATNSVGTGPVSNTATATTAAVSSVPGAPASITAGSPTASSVAVSWAPPTTGGVVQGYNVLYKLVAASSYTTFSSITVCYPGVGSISAGGLIWTVTVGGKIAVNGVEDSPTGNVTTMTYIGGLIWQLTANGDWYSEPPINNDAWGPPTTTPPWSVVVTGLSASTAYSFEVTAFNSIGTGSPVGPATATTSAAAGTILTDGLPLTQAQVNAIMSAINVQQQADVPGGEPFAGYYIPQDALIGDVIITTAANLQLTGNIGSLTDSNGDVWTLQSGDAWWWGGIARNGVQLWGGYNIAIRLLYDGTVWVEEAKGGGWWSLTAWTTQGGRPGDGPSPGPGPNN